MKRIDILGANRFETFTKTRVGSRGFVLSDGGEILLAREEKTDWWLLPGGGLEAGETPEACCAREVLEETGLAVEPVRQFLILHEYYEEYRYVSHYFECRVTGRGEQRLTPAEAERGLVPRWLPVEEYLAIVSRHQDWAPVSEEKRGAYLRDYTALSEFLRQGGVSG